MSMTFIEHLLADRAREHAAARQLYQRSNRRLDDAIRQALGSGWTRYRIWQHCHTHGLEIRQSAIYERASKLRPTNPDQGDQK